MWMHLRVQSVVYHFRGPFDFDLLRQSSKNNRVFSISICFGIVIPSSWLSIYYGQPWLCANHTLNSGFDQTFMRCSGYSLCAAEQQAGYQISWVNLQREAKLSMNR